MRHWINLIEHAGYGESQREKIISHMITHLTQGMYWDTTAIDPKTGQPMNDDSASDMASTWHEFGAFPDLGEHNPHDPNFHDTGIFQKKLVAWANERYDEVDAKLKAIPLVDGYFSISRIIRVKDWVPQDGLGIYWTFDFQGADMAESPWARDAEGHNIWMHGYVRPHDVDWFNTYLANMDWMSGDVEHELRVNRGATIWLASYEYADEGHQIQMGIEFKA